MKFYRAISAVWIGYLVVSALCMVIMLADAQGKKVEKFKSYELNFPMYPIEPSDRDFVVRYR